MADPGNGGKSVIFVKISKFCAAKMIKLYISTLNWSPSAMDNMLTYTVNKKLRKSCLRGFDKTSKTLKN